MSLKIGHNSDGTVVAVLTGKQAMCERDYLIDRLIRMENQIEAHRQFYEWWDKMKKRAKDARVRVPE